MATHKRGCYATGKSEVYVFVSYVLISHIHPNTPLDLASTEFLRIVREKPDAVHDKLLTFLNKL